MAVNPKQRVCIFLLYSEPIVRFGNRIVSINRKDALHLLIYLADETKNEYDREKLAITLFGEDSKPQRMRDALFLLHKSLNESGVNQKIIQGQKKLEIDRSMLWVDTHNFAQKAKKLLTQVDQEQMPDFIGELQAVLALYTSHFLQEYVFESHELSIWQEKRQSELVQLRHSLLEKIVQFHIHQGAIADAQAFTEIWLNSLEPGFVPLQYLIWIGLKRRHFGLVQHYLSLLQEHQDKDPVFFGTDVATWRLLIENNTEPSLALLRLSQVIVPPTAIEVERDFVGREDKLPDLVSLLTRSKPPHIIGLIGLPGVGKTRFAQQVTEVLQHSLAKFDFAWVELRSDSDIEMLLNDVLSKFHLNHVKTLPYTAKQKRFKQLMQGHHYLIVIDEGTSKKLSVSTFLEALVGLFEGVDLLLIARQLPDIPHYPFELLGFNTPQIRQFLVAQIPELNDVDLPLFEQVKQITNGLPLVLNWLRGFLKERRFQFASFLRALSILQTTTWDLENTLVNYTYMLDWLWNQLGLDEKNLLFTVSMFDATSGVTLENIAAVADASFPMIPDQLQRKLNMLRNLSLLQGQVQSDSVSCYSLHPIVYDYIQQQGQRNIASFQSSAIQEAYVLHFMDFVNTHARDFATLDQNKNNILRLFELGLSFNTRPNLRLEIITALNNIYDYLERCGLYAKSEQLLSEALKIDEISHAQRAKLLLHLGQAAFKQGQQDDTERRLSEAWNLAQSIELSEIYGIILRDLGRVYLQRNDSDKAVEYLLRGSHYAEQQGQFVLRGQIMANLGVIALDLKGQIGEAQNYFESIVRDLHHKSDDANWAYEYQDVLQFVETMLGRIAITQNLYKDAERHFERSLAMARTLNNPERIARVYLNLGAVSYNQSDFEVALDYFTQADVVAESIQHGELLIRSLWNKGAVNVVLQQYRPAKQMLQSALNQANELDLKSIIPYVFIWLGILYFCQLQMDYAQRYFLEVFDQVALNSWFAALALYGLSLIIRHENDLGMQDDSEAAKQQISTIFASLHLSPKKLPVVTLQDLERAQGYFQVALHDRPGLRNFHIVEAVLVWLTFSD